MLGHQCDQAAVTVHIRLLLWADTYIHALSLDWHIFSMCNKWWQRTLLLKETSRKRERCFPCLLQTPRVLCTWCDSLPGWRCSLLCGADCPGALQHAARRRRRALRGQPFPPARWASSWGHEPEDCSPPRHHSQLLRDWQQEHPCCSLHMAEEVERMQKGSCLSRFLLSRLSFFSLSKSCSNVRIFAEHFRGVQVKVWLSCCVLAHKWLCTTEKENCLIESYIHH